MLYIWTNFKKMFIITIYIYIHKYIHNQKTWGKKNVIIPCLNQNINALKINANHKNKKLVILRFPTD